jgi:hypothetical protein
MDLAKIQLEEARRRDNLPAQLFQKSLFGRYQLSLEIYLRVIPGQAGDSFSLRLIGVALASRNRQRGIQEVLEFLRYMESKNCGQDIRKELYEKNSQLDARFNTFSGLNLVGRGA